MPSPQNKTELRIKLADLLKAGKYRKVEKLLERHHDKRYNDTQIWKLFAQASVQTGNYPNIIHCCRKILDIAPGNIQVMFNLAVALHNNGDRQVAIEMYQQCTASHSLPTEHRAMAHASLARLHMLEMNKTAAEKEFLNSLEITNNPVVRTDLAEYLMSQDRYPEAMTHLKDAMTQHPNLTKAQFLLAQLHYETGNFSTSEQLYRRFTNNHPDHVNALNNLGRVYEELGNLEDAISCYQHCAELSSSNALIHRNLGRVLAKLNLFERADTTLNEARRLEPQHPDTYLLLGRLYIEQNRGDDARNVLNYALTLDVERYIKDPYGFISDVRYFLSNMENPDIFDNDKKIFVAGLFDKYAENFDEHLVNKLKYRTPEIVNDLLSKHNKRYDNETMDLGCGTGLVCRYLKPISSSVCGLDLSSKMIDKARELGCYDELIVGEICEILDARDKCYDLIIAADVLVYIGSLNDVFRSVSYRMKVDSCFIFSVERLDEDLDYRQFASGRHKHSIAYIDRLLAEHNMHLIERVDCVLRQEHQQDVQGCAIIAHRR